VRIERNQNKQKRELIVFFTQFNGLVRRFLGKTGGRTQSREEKKRRERKRERVQERTPAGHVAQENSD